MLKHVNRIRQHTRTRSRLSQSVSQSAPSHPGPYVLEYRRRTVPRPVEVFLEGIDIVRDKTFACSDRGCSPTDATLLA